MASKALQEIQASPYRRSMQKGSYKSSATKPSPSSSSYQIANTQQNISQNNFSQQEAYSFLPPMQSQSQQLKIHSKFTQNSFVYEHPVYSNQQQQEMQMSKAARNMSENRQTQISNPTPLGQTQQMRGGSMSRSTSNLTSTPSKIKDSQATTTLAKFSPTAEQQQKHQESAQPSRLPSKALPSSQSQTQLTNNRHNSKENINHSISFPTNPSPHGHYKDSTPSSICRTTTTTTTSQVNPPKSFIHELSSDVATMSTMANNLNQSTVANSNNAYHQSSNASIHMSPRSRHPAASFNNSNVLNSSSTWKVNSIPGQTPKKNGQSKVQGQYQKNSSKKVLSPHNGYSPLKPQKMSQQSDGSSNSYLRQNSSIHQAHSPQEFQRSEYSQERTRLNKNYADLPSSMNHVNELKRLKQEIDQFKNREIKYLVRIATLERETKKLNEKSDRGDAAAEYSNMITNLRQKRAHLSSSSSLSSATVGSNPFEEAKLSGDRRITRQQTEEEDFTANDWTAHSLSTTMRTPAATGRNQVSCDKSSFKAKYIQLRGNHKETMQLILEREKDYAELAAEAKLLRSLLVGKIAAGSQQQEATSSLLKALALSSTFSTDSPPIK